jgi:UTP--glucose-1-phosphate uridylyltransferase
MTARKHISGEPFAVLLGDDLIVNKTPCTRQLIEVFNKYRCSTIAVEEIPQDKVSSYGIIKGNFLSDSICSIEEIVEKPAVEEAPSNIGAIGRYIFTPEIFDCIKMADCGVGGEIQLTDGIRLLNEKQNVYAYRFAGKRYDTGDKLCYVKAVIDFAMQNESFGADVKTYLNDLSPA